MKFPLIVTVALAIVQSTASAAGPASPRLAELAAKVAAGQRAAEDAFWSQVADVGTPLVEDVHDPKGRLLVTFLYRARSDTRAVAVYGVPGYCAALERMPGTSVFAYSVLLDRTARFTYSLAPGDDFGPLRGDEADLRKRDRLQQPDLLNKHPFFRSSLVELPGAPVQATLVPHRDTPTGELVELTVKSKALGNARSVAIYTPPGFRTTGTSYPLIVLFDGLEEFVSLGLTITLDELIAAHRIPPVVVVAVGNVDRDHELPRNAAFADFVALDLVPWVRRTYHATDDRRRTVVAGISYGGIAAAFAAARHPEVYGNVLSQSGSYWWSDDDELEGEAHARDYAAQPRIPVRFWLDVGALEQGIPVDRGYDQVISNRHMRDVLLARGYDVTYSEFAGGHKSEWWRGTIVDGLVALLTRPWSVTGHLPAVRGKPGGIDVGEARPVLIGKLERMAMLDGGDAAVAWLATQPKLTEKEVSRAADAVLDLGHPGAALPLYAWTAQRLADSAGAQDDLAIAAWDAGDRPRAIASFQRELQLDPKRARAQRMLELLR